MLVKLEEEVVDELRAADVVDHVEVVCRRRCRRRRDFTEADFQVFG